MPLQEVCTQLLESGRFSDITIVCGTSEFKCHRAVVCTQSSVFDTAFNSDFKEAQSSVMKLEDDDPTAVRSMIRFLYSEDYTIEDAISTDIHVSDEKTGSPLESHFAVYMAADKYDIEPLKTLVQAKVSKILNSTANRPQKSSILAVLSDYICALQSTDLLRKEFIGWLITRTVRSDGNSRDSMDLSKDDTFRELLKCDWGLASQYMDMMADRLSRAEKHVWVASAVLGEAFRVSREYFGHDISISNHCSRCGNVKGVLYGCDGITNQAIAEDMLFVCKGCKQVTGYAKAFYEV